jgi:YD repeat-containing protein
LLVGLVACLLLAPVPATSQQAAIHYVYDDLNRLIAVVDQQGNVGTYTYDATGNLLRVDRFDAAAIPGAVGITLVSPNKGKVGTTVQIFGKGFSATPSQNSVVFNGTAATVTAAAPNRIVTSVPTGATTGPITVTTPLGSATSPTPFTVLGTITVSPTTATLFTDATQQFTATDDGGSTASVSWSVNGIVGGDPTVGTISTEGFYTAPATVPAPSTVTITAEHADDRTLSASASITITPRPLAFLISPRVSVTFAQRTVDKNLTSSVSVHVAVPTSLAVAGQIGVQVAPALAAAVAGAVGVQVAPATAFVVTPEVGVALEPVITSISPVSATAGTTSFSITITGVGFSGATSLTFLRSNAADASITVTNLAVNPDGTQATATISIAAGAALGARVVQIATPARTSTAAGTGGNLFTVQ